MSSSSSSSSCECPICFDPFPASVLAQHAANCQGKRPDKARKKTGWIDTSPAPSSSSSSSPSSWFSKNNKKRPASDSASASNVGTETSTESGTLEKKAKVEKNGQFGQAKDNKKGVPWAEQLRPQLLSQIMGQGEVTGDKAMLRTLLEKGEVPSLVLWGPPGCGKTSLANVIAHNCKNQGSKTRFVKLSACTAGVADVKEVVKTAKNEQRLMGRRTLLFIDEVHRFNKLQQDAFLPHVEDGTITLVGATTENPSFSLNNALLSRCRVVALSKLSTSAVYSILKRAAESNGCMIVPDDGVCHRGNGGEQKIMKDALTYLANMSDGDARTAINCLQIACDSQPSAQPISLEVIKESLKRAHINYDRKGDEHYHCASALQKSIRGSDDNAALYWCMRMLHGGEDPMFIARRLVRIASEDVGLGDPQALPLAVAAMQGCQLIGKPECNVLLAEATVYLARAKKSHEVYMAMENVLHTFKEGNLPGVPLHLRQASTKLARQMGYGQGYSFDLSKVKGIEYMPEGLENADFFSMPNSK